MLVGCCEFLLRGLGILGDSRGWLGMLEDAWRCLWMLVDAWGCLGMLGDAWRQVIRGQVWRWWQSGGTTLSRSIRLIFPVERRNPESLPIRKWHRRISSFFCFDLSLSLPPSLPPSIHTHTHTCIYVYIYLLIYRITRATSGSFAYSVSERQE